MTDVIEGQEDNPVPTEHSAMAIRQEFPAAAKRALAEAAERRKELEQKKAAAVREINGRDGPDPVRFGDWEKKGIAIDF